MIRRESCACPAAGAYQALHERPLSAAKIEYASSNATRGGAESKYAPATASSAMAMCSTRSSRCR